MSQPPETKFWTKTGEETKRGNANRGNCLSIQTLNSGTILVKRNKHEIDRSMNDLDLSVGTLQRKKPPDDKTYYIPGRQHIRQTSCQSSEAELSGRTPETRELTFEIHEKTVTHVSAVYTAYLSTLYRFCTLAIEQSATWT